MTTPKKKVKKAVAKPAVKAAAKSAPKAKKTAAPAKAVETVVVAPVAVPACGCGCGHKGRWLKKLLWFIIAFALGFAACKFCPHHGMMMKRMHWSFVDGCLDTSKIKCPEMAQKILAADVDGNSCITKEELKTWKKAEFAGHKKYKGECGCDKAKAEQQPESAE